MTCLLRNLYAGQEATVRTGHGTTDWFQIGKGVRQGCIKPLPPSRVHASPPPLTCTGLAAARPLNHPLPRIHQPPKLGAASLGRLWVFDAAFCHRHSLLWKRKANTELNPSDFMAGELYSPASSAKGRRPGGLPEEKKKAPPAGDEALGGYGAPPAGKGGKGALPSALG